MSARVASLVGLRPADEIEGMSGSQLIASHNAAMEYYSARPALPTRAGLAGGKDAAAERGACQGTKRAWSAAT
jgi:hypothetical protein